jgi:hypothetical protein
MPILYVHGVNTRSRSGFLEIEPLLRQHVAPAISDDPASVPIDDYFWGPLGVRLFWDGASRPRTRIAGKGAIRAADDIVARGLIINEHRAAVQRVPKAAVAARPSKVVPKGARRSSGPRAIRPLTDLKQDELATFLSGLLVNTLQQRGERSGPGDARAPTGSKKAPLKEATATTAAAVAGSPEPTDAERRAANAQALLLTAADEVAHDPRTQQILAGKSPEEQIALVLKRVREAAEKHAPDQPKGKGRLAAKGHAADFFSSLWDDVTEAAEEALDRANDLPGYLLSVALAELRPWLNDTVSIFLGDVFWYLRSRDDPATRPGKILSGLVEALKKAHKHKVERNEPLVVVTHSMGGQLIWDAVTWRLPQDPEVKDIKIDFWCATASQVGFFEEAKLFAASDQAYRTGKPVPYPAGNLGAWWNVWDYNDFLSFTAKNICADVDDEAYNSGSSLLHAHGGYLARVDFFRLFASKVEQSRRKGFRP